MTSALLVRAAAGLLPPALNERFCAEWSAELQVVRSQVGRGAALSFAGALVPAAVRTTIDLRSDDKESYAELSVAALCALPPMVFLLVFSVANNIWIMVGAALLAIVGILLSAHGLWRHDGRVLESMSSRVGLVLVLLGAISGMILVGRLPELAPVDPDEVIPRDIPNAAIPVGFFFLVVARYTGRLQRRFQRLSFWILAPGAAGAVAVAIVNAANSSGVSSVLSLLYGVPILGLAWASYVIAGRSSGSVDREPDALAAV